MAILWVCQMRVAHLLWESKRAEAAPWTKLWCGILFSLSILSTKEITIVPTKVNIVLDDDVKADLDRLVDSGLRSRVVNRALRKEILAIRRQRASQRLDELRRTTKPISTTELVALLRRDRER